MHRFPSDAILVVDLGPKIYNGAIPAVRFLYDHVPLSQSSHTFILLDTTSVVDCRPSYRLVVPCGEFYRISPFLAKISFQSLNIGGMALHHRSDFSLIFTVGHIYHFNAFRELWIAISAVHFRLEKSVSTIDLGSLRSRPFQITAI